MQNKFENNKIILKTDDPNARLDSAPPLTKLSLRSNQLKGNIILGNFAVSPQKTILFQSILFLNHF